VVTGHPRRFSLAIVGGQRLLVSVVLTECGHVCTTRSGLLHPPLLGAQKARDDRAVPPIA
jgi:hypothetical protein